MKKSISATLGAAVLLALGSQQSLATPFTTMSPVLGGSAPAGITEIGGVVFDAIGLNDARLTAQLAASELFVGFYDSGTPVAFEGNPGTIGIQTGFGDAVTSQLGGGLKELAIRITVDDGDTATNNFDEGDNDLLINGINVGDWTGVEAQTTNSTGTTGGSFSGGGFRNNILDTGWFYITDAMTLASIFAAIDAADQVVYQIDDVDPFDNFFDFTQGVDGALINVGQGPVVTPTPTPGGNVPAPATLLLLGAGLAGLGMRKRKA